MGDQNNAYWGGQHAGFLGPKWDPLFLHDETWIPGDSLLGLSPTADVTADRQSARAALPTGRGASEADDFTRLQRQALDMLRSLAAWKAFRLDDENPGTVER